VGILQRFVHAPSMIGATGNPFEHQVLSRLMHVGWFTGI
jgi:hypothetical protein